jgi:hypothetical protein
MNGKIRWRDVFEELDPPPGGLEGLRRRLDEVEMHRLRRSPSALVWQTAAAAVVCAVLVLAMAGVLRHANEPERRWRQQIISLANPALVRLGLQLAPTDTVTVPPAARDQIAIKQVSVDTPGVVYYRVAIVDTPRSIDQPSTADPGTARLN